MAAQVPIPKQRRYAKLRQEGWARAAACREVGVSYDWAVKFDKGHHNSGQAYKAAKLERAIPEPLPYERLSDHAKLGLEDFEFFRRYYLGHVSTPWQVETAYTLVELLESPGKEHVVENAPPGVGKSTLITDIGTWVTCRRRSIRGLMGSRKARNAERQVLRIRRNLERVVPFKPPTEDVARGLALDAQATLAAHYGLFKPITNADVWRAEEFIVAQFDDVPIEEKEPTWSSYGVDSGVLGNRFNIIFWDDLVDRGNTRTFDAMAELEEKWESELENRLEPGGLLILLGQQMRSGDLYAYCRAKRTEDDDGEATDQPMYHRIRYQAHDESRCEGIHKPSKAQPWPNGCLLDPYRLPWRELASIRRNNPGRYAVQYQQDEADPSTLFVPDEWLKGGVDPENGSMCPGCHDEQRDMLELPPGLVPPLISVATVDPSPTKMWAVQWWVYAPNAFHQAFLMDLLNKAMGGNELLDFNANEACHYGVMEEWQRRSVEMGLPITHWVVEVNAAQRFLLQYDHVRRWLQKWRVAIIPHTTSARKTDDDLGPDMIRSWFQFGRMRLPWKLNSMGRRLSLKFEEQLRGFPNMRMDDQVMGCWFLVKNLPDITPVAGQGAKVWRPTWMREAV